MFSNIAGIDHQIFVGPPVDPQLGGELLERGFALADEPVVRRRLAQVQLTTGGCLPALKTLEGIPAKARTDADTDLREACGTYAPGAGISGPALSSVVALVTSGLAARREGRLAIPYGVAISAAGLWVLAAHYFPAAGHAIGLSA